MLQLYPYRNKGRRDVLNDQTNPTKIKESPDSGNNKSPVKMLADTYWLKRGDIKENGTGVIEIKLPPLSSVNWWKAPKQANVGLA